MINLNVFWSLFWIIVYWLCLVLLFVFIKKRLRVLLERQIKYTEVHALEVGYNRLIKIVLLCMILMFVWSSFFILVYTAPEPKNIEVWDFQDNFPTDRFR